ncbi:uncharacterized protein [Amphiura filiformis]|uniref:uncharacterized protein n=1 Tax=Amphiura filiformis TaxID=82378 RepID=UPI003B2132F0
MAQVQDPKTDGADGELEMNSSEQNGGSSGGVLAPSTFVFGQNMESRVVKRTADEQLDPESAEKEDDKEDEPGEFPKASASVMAQRPIIAPVSAFRDKQPQSAAEGDSEKATFKLAPATFGASRTEERVTSEAMTTPASSAAPVLATPHEWQPTFGSVAKSSSTPFKLKESALQAAAEHVNGKGQHKKEEESKGASSTSETMDEAEKSPSTDQNDAASKSPSENTDSKPSSTEGPSSSTDKRNNYFIKLNDGTERRNVGFGVFGTFSDSQIGTVSFGKPEKEHDGGTAENYFLQFANNGSEGSLPASAGTTPITSPVQVQPSSASPPQSNLSLSGSGSSFIFGQHMNERVTSVNKKEGELETAAEFVFGQNLGDRVKSEEGDDSSSADAPLFSPDASGKTLAENANAYAEAKESSRVKFEQVPKLTGEEDEEHVLQVQCKLYIFDVTKRLWQERGRGMLRLNDRRQSTPDADTAIQSRLVMRTQGSLRVILNTKLWSTMILEKASSKSLRISALDSETKTPRVFLISSTPKDAEQMYRAIEYRIQELKHVEHMKAENDATPDTASSTNQEEDEKDEDEETNDSEPHSRTEEEKEEKEEDKNETGEVTSSTKTGSDGALQSAETQDSQNEQDKADDTTEKETT